jgi:hypothetical protein
LRKSITEVSLNFIFSASAFLSALRAFLDYLMVGARLSLASLWARCSAALAWAVALTLAAYSWSTFFYLAA